MPRLTVPAIAALMLLAGACGTDDTGPEDEQGPAATAPSPERGEDGDAVDREPGPDDDATMLEQMSLEEKVRQLLMLHVYGSRIDEREHGAAAANTSLYGVETIGEVIREHRPGGVIFVARNPLDEDSARVPTRNLLSLDQIAELTAAIQEVSRTATGSGALISTDQEQGPIRRLPDPAPDLAGGAELGTTGDVELARENAVLTGRELLEVGINVNLAPVADVNTNPDNPVIGDRAFGSDPALVAAMTAAQVEGYTDAGVVATAKHFPGHGAADADSHHELPVIDADRGAWEDIHLRPFAAAIEAGVPAIMPAHLVAPALDGTGAPATISPAILTDLLREEMGFDGVIITDALWMDAIRGVDSAAEVAVRALEAGVDILLMPPDAAAVVDGIVRAVEQGRLTEDRIDVSVRRVLDLKAGLGLLGRR
jgi:beta-N-acetylhexosaminidase